MKTWHALHWRSGFSLGVLVVLLLAACTPAAPTPTAPAAAPVAKPTEVPKPAAAAKPAQLEKVSFMLAFRANGIYAPLYYARDKGYFAEEGIDLELIEGTGSAASAKIIAAGTSPIGAIDASVVMDSAAQNVPVKSVAGIIQTSPMSVQLPKSSGVTDPKGLAGKKLGGMPGGASEVLLASWLSANGVDPNKVEMVAVTTATRVTSLLQGQVDGILGFDYTNVPALKAKGMDVVVIRYADFGFNVPSITIAGNTTFVKEKPNLVRGVVAAALKGYREAERNPRAAVESIMKLASASDADVETQTLTLMYPSVHTKRTANRPLGWMAPEDWQEAIDVLVKAGQLSRAPRVEDAMTNEFIPAQ